MGLQQASQLAWAQVQAQAQAGSHSIESGSRASSEGDAPRDGRWGLADWTQRRLRSTGSRSQREGRSSDTCRRY